MRTEQCLEVLLKPWILALIPWKILSLQKIQQWQKITVVVVTKRETHTERERERERERDF